MLADVTSADGTDVRVIDEGRGPVMRGQGHDANDHAPGEVARVIETFADRVLR